MDAIVAKRYGRPAGSKATKQLLCVENDAKTRKGTGRGFLTGVLYLAPADTATKRSLCPFATAGCKAMCLNTAGRGAFDSVQEGRAAKARLFEDDRTLFMWHLVGSVRKVVAQARRRGLEPVIRLNGTSDIMWERIALEIDGVRFANIMGAFPEVQFYDYTKIPLAYRKALPTNYHLTFSQAENNAADVADAIARGVNVAVVFDRVENIPAVYLGLEVISGDADDLRFLDPRTRVVSLYAKGRAKRDVSGFVVRPAAAV